MRTRHQAQPHRPPYRLCDLPLIHQPQPRLLAVLDPPHLRHILAHDAEVRIQRRRVQRQRVERVGRGALGPFPLALFGGR